MRYQPSVHHPAWMFGLFAVLLLLALAPGAALLARRAWTARAAALGSALLMLPGLLLAAVVGLALDLGGVNFLPPR